MGFSWHLPNPKDRVEAGKQVSIPAQILRRMRPYLSDESPGFALAGALTGADRYQTSHCARFDRSEKTLLCSDHHPTRWL